MDIIHKIACNQHATNAAKPHDNQRVLEGDHSALRVCEPSILTHRKSDISDAGILKYMIVYIYILYSCIHIIYVSSFVYIYIISYIYIYITQNGNIHQHSISIASSVGCQELNQWL